MVFACRRIYAPVKDHGRVKPLLDLAGRGVSQCNKDALLKLSAHGYDLLGSPWPQAPFFFWGGVAEDVFYQHILLKTR